MIVRLIRNSHTDNLEVRHGNYTHWTRTDVKDETAKGI